MFPDIRISPETLRALETAPNMYLVLSPGLYILTASDLYLEATETTREAIVGKHIFEAFPENPELPDADGVQNINASLQEVLATKKPHYMSIQRYDVPDNSNPGSFIPRYWDPSHTPVLDEHGEILYIIQLATNVTQQVLIQKALAVSQEQERQMLVQVEELNDELEASNEEINASNEELLQTQESLKQLNKELEDRIVVRTEDLEATNEELTAANEELQRSYQSLTHIQQKLESTVNELKSSRERFRSMIQASPVAMLVTRGNNMVFEEINEAMLQLLGKDVSVKGKPWFEAMPELIGHPIIDGLYHTYSTGNEHKIIEAPIIITKGGLPYQGYYNITYTPLIEEGSISGVMQSIVEVTGYITAKNELSKAYEQVRLSKEAAELGTFDMDLVNGHMEWDARCRQLFGISHQDKVTFEKDFLTGLHPDDTERVKAIIENVFNKLVSNGVYDVEYRTIGVDDGQLRWVRAKGQVYFDEFDQPLRFIGSVLDITEQKQDEQRKNDFIGMASHELKTPLTSLSAYLQMLQAKARKAEDTFTSVALEKSVTQVKKMTSMINGFLNVSRLESGKIHIDKQSFDMAGLMKEAEEEAIATVTSHKVVFVPVKETYVIADRDKIGQVINNFVSNAVKYSPLGTTITIACVIVSGYALVSVADEGLGIKHNDQHKLFDRYYRVESNSAHIAGFGIGLYLCAEIIKRHEGKIWVESELGNGSIFYFSVPLQKRNT
jgi:two-component system sensor histidine kinase VicK